MGEGRPYPDHGLVSTRQWAQVPPRLVRLDELVTTKRTLDLGSLLSDDSTFATCTLEELLGAGALAARATSALRRRYLPA